jgi:hypothetical protein
MAAYVISNSLSKDAAQADVPWLFQKFVLWLVRALLIASFNPGRNKQNSIDMARAFRGDRHSSDMDWSIFYSEI